jgi:hypothetical protein
MVGNSVEWLDKLLVGKWDPSMVEKWVERKAQYITDIDLPLPLVINNSDKIENRRVNHCNMDYYLRHCFPDNY